MKSARNENGGDRTVVPVFDGHNDLATALRWPKRSGPRDVFARNATGHLDVPRMREGGMAGGFFSAFVPSTVEPNDFAAHADGRGHYRLPLPPILDPDVALRHVLGMLVGLHRLADASEGALRIVRSPTEMEASLRDGAIGVALHVEGADAIDPDFEALHVLHQCGVRALGLAWSRPNGFAQGVPLTFPATPHQGAGLTPEGRALVAACDELGILVDVSHLTEAGFWDVLDVAQGPVVASHSNAHAICPHSRNLTDRQLDALAERGGLVGVNFGVGFLDPDGAWDQTASLDLVVRHVDHLLDRLGPHGVGFGSDFDGARIPAAIGDASGLQNLIGVLRDAGYDAETLADLGHRNWLRTWGRAQRA